MNVQEQIDFYIASLPEPKRSDMQALHQRTLQVSPACKLWFNDGKNAEGKTIAKIPPSFNESIPRFTK